MTIDDVDWEPLADDETATEWALPQGFLECLVDPGVEPALILRVAPALLPEKWTIRRAEGDVLITHLTWRKAGSRDEARVPLKGERLPLFVFVEWVDEGERRQCGWAVNVTEPGRLPPPDELRDLPVDALLRALASMRPMHEALTLELRRHERISTDPELDPLRRYSDSGQLFARARRLSAALIGSAAPTRATCVQPRCPQVAAARAVRPARTCSGASSTSSRDRTRRSAARRASCLRNSLSHSHASTGRQLRGCSC